MRSPTVVNPDIKTAESILKDWWGSRQQSSLMRHAYPKTSPGFEQAQSGRQWDSLAEIADAYTHRGELDVIDEIMEEMHHSHCAAINMKLRNKEAGAQVWRSDIAGNYDEALADFARRLKEKGVL